MFIAPALLFVRSLRSGMLDEQCSLRSDGARHVLAIRGYKHGAPPEHGARKAISQEHLLCKAGAEKSAF
jgi:hypothetical protein